MVDLELFGLFECLGNSLRYSILTRRLLINSYNGIHRTEPRATRNGFGQHANFIIDAEPFALVQQSHKADSLSSSLRRYQR